MLELRKIIKENDPILRKKSVDVTFPLSEEDEATIKYLSEYLEFASDEENCKKYGLRAGVGLAAPQVGVNKKMAAIRIDMYDKNDKLITKRYAFINPKIISHSTNKTALHSGEGCLSVDNDREGYVYRYSFVTVQAYDYLTKQNVKIKFRGYEAIVVQHELDHLEGILYFDHINKKKPFEELEGATLL